MAVQVDDARDLTIPLAREVEVCGDVEPRFTLEDQLVDGVAWPLKLPGPFCQKRRSFSLRMQSQRPGKLVFESFAFSLPRFEDVDILQALFRNALSLAHQLPLGRRKPSSDVPLFVPGLPDRQSPLRQRMMPRHSVRADRRTTPAGRLSAPGQFGARSLMAYRNRGALKAEPARKPRDSRSAA